MHKLNDLMKNEQQICCFFSKKKAKGLSHYLFTFLIAFIVIFSTTVKINASTPLKDASQVRILMTAFSAMPELSIEIYGNYVLNETLSFQRGNQLKVSHLNGQFQVRYEGLVYLAGTNLRLKRYSTEDNQENGLRFNSQMNLYPGDLSLTIQGNQFQPIITLPLEDYLQGVVPFEMADEFPMEALKAQAIAARTYSVKHLSPDKGYDMVDNTNDQVFRGVNPDKSNAIQAVLDTKGIVIYYQGAPASAFYTASNGGFTESAFNAWGRESIPYLNIQKDPYDIENPMSITRTVRLNKDLIREVSGETKALIEHINTLIPSRLVLMGYEEDTPYRLEAISDASTHTGKYGGNDGVMRNLRLDFKLSVHVPAEDSDTEISLTAPQGSGTGQTESPGSERLVWQSTSMAIDLTIFPDLEQMFGLSINRNENEIITVQEEDASFLIRSARYGHGVGMSQRGAEWMAMEYGWKYDQILRFYYPGTELITLTVQDVKLPEMDLNYSTTPGPVPTATPRPTLMPLTVLDNYTSKIVYVTGIAMDSSLNLRQNPDYLADIVTRLYYGQALMVLEEYEDGWLKVKTDTLMGYIRHEYIGSDQP